MAIKRIHLREVKTGNKQNDKAFDDVRRAFVDIYDRIERAQGDTTSIVNSLAEEGIITEDLSRKFALLLGA